MPLQPAEIVSALHFAVFGIAPQRDVAEQLVGEIGDDPDALTAVAARLFDFATTMRNIGRNTMPDHSQGGELRILLREVMAIGRRHGIIVDVGVLGTEGSNSYDLLASFGWSGLLIEANPALIDGIRQAFGPVDARLINCAVGPVAGRLPFYLAPFDGGSSLVREHAARWGDLRGEVDVEVRRLHDILDEAGIPHDFDILDLDIEGSDVAVMNDLIANSPYRPRIVLIEASYFFKTQDLSEVGLSAEVQSLYRILDRTAANLILGQT